MKYFLILTVIIFISCTNKYTIDNRIKKAKILSHNNNFKSYVIETTDFKIQTYIKKSPSKILKVYIEGDGLAWIDKYTISPNPTPVNPISLRLATIDKSKKNILYIARPCQYITYNCNNKYWTSHRFSAKIINNVNQTISILKKKLKVSKIELIGFSGGAAIVVLIASIRDDISSIVTIAGNLDHKALHKYHNVTQLSNSLNPIDVAKKISNIPQIHYIGTKDNIIPAFISKSFKQYSNNKNIKIINVINNTHTKGWVDYFKRIN